MNENNTANNFNYIRSTSSDDIDIRGLFDIICQRKKLLLLIIILGSLLTFSLTFLINTSYTAHSSILIDNDNSSYQNQDINSLAKSFTLDIGFILTEIEVLKSRNLIEKTVKYLNLTQDEEFNISTKIQDILDTQDSSKTQSDSNEQDTVSNLLKVLRVTSVPGSLAVKISITSKDSDKAALITNTLVDEYIKQRIKTKYEGQRKLIKWLDKRVVILREQVLKAEIKTEEYRAANNLNPGRHGLISSEQLTALNNQHVLAQTNYSDAKAKLSQASKSNTAEIDASVSGNSINASLIKSLNLEKLAIEANISELSSRYGYKHPIMIEKKDELAEIDNKISTQLKKVKKSLKNDLSIAKAQLNEIKNIVKKATGKNNIDSSAMIRLRELEREASTSRNILKTFLEKYKSIVGKDVIQDPGVRVISYANAPTIPSSPDKRLIIALGIFLSSIIGLAFIFLNEKLYNKFRTPESLEQAFGLTCLSSIPFIRSGWNKQLANQVLSNPSSPIVEALRNLRISLKNQKSKTGETPKVISILSSLKNEGKTTIAITMSALSAKAGERVILIDANLRAPSVHEALDKSNNNNLVDYLTNQKDLKDVIYKDKETGLDIIFGHSVPNNSFNLLSMNKLDILIEALRQSYDLVVIDTPACLEASDARLIEQLSDISLYNVKYNSTKDKTVAQGIKSFQNHENPALAFILTYTK